MLHISRLVGAQAEVLSAYRFLEARRIVSWPIIPCAYDILVDGGDRIYRVQVKRARGSDHTGTRWRVRLTKSNPKGDRPQPITDLDFLCIVCEPDTAFVIPVQACASPTDVRYLNARIEIGPQSRYQVFKNRFAIGTGLSAEIGCVPIPAVQIAASPKEYRCRGLIPSRKAHVRLSTVQIEQILQMPIRWERAQAGVNLIPVEQIALQFGVSVTTLRNYFRRKRKDL